MNRLKFFRNRRPVGHVDAESLWVQDANENLHLVDADSSVVVSDPNDQRVGMFVEVDQPTDINPDDIPIHV